MLFLRLNGSHHAPESGSHLIPATSRLGVSGSAVRLGGLLFLGWGGNLFGGVGVGWHGVSVVLGVLADLAGSSCDRGTLLLLGLLLRQFDLVRSGVLDSVNRQEASVCAVSLSSD